VTDLRWLAEAATPGPWESAGDEVYAGEGDSYSLVARIPDSEVQDADAALIATMRNSLDALLDVVDAARPVLRHTGAIPTKEWRTLNDALARLGEVVK
jgi:hypothetical protein